MRRHRRSMLCLEHDFFPDGGWASVRIEPRQATARLLQRHRIGLRQRPAGLELIVATGQAGAPDLPLPVADRLELLVCADDSAFALYTDLADLPAGFLLHFDGVLDRDGTLKLRRADALARAADDPSAAVALLRVQGAWLAAADGESTAAAQTVLRLPASAAYWRYYCALPRSADVEALAIVQRRSDRDRRQIEFAPSGRIDFGDAADTDDPVARGLHSARPGARIVALTSAAAVPARAVACPHLTLMLGEQALVERLPSPPLSSLLAARRPGEAQRHGAAIAFRTVDAFSHPS